MKKRLTPVWFTLLILTLSIAVACGGSDGGGGAKPAQTAVPDKTAGNVPQDSASSAPPRQGAAAQPSSAAQPTAPVSSRSVIINAERLSDQQIEAFERTFRVRIMDGNYWYDRMNGSWGRQGGPTEGFIAAGLNLGGPLRPDASNGDTGVFINGRQLHRVDVARLRQIGPVYRGRCWMDAYGNIGLEGQPAFGNVWLAAAQASRGGGRREGILSTYDKTGAAVIGY